jgi:hypothetical protein
VYGRVPWQAVYSAAHLYALRTSSGLPDPGGAETAVRLLRLAVSDPDCDLVRPSEWIAMDPDLRSLRGFPSFDAFVREQARWDFAPSPVTTAGDPWFRQRLPDSGAAAAGGAPPAHVSSARPTRKGPDPAALVPSPAPPAGQAAASQESKRKPRHSVP